jgi:ketosteroid isomerase-like protein
MSQENVEIVRRGYETMTRVLAEWPSELPDLSEFLDPEIEWRGPREFPDLAEPRYGHEGVLSYIGTLFEALEEYRMVPEEFIDAGPDRVLVFSREGGRGKGSGAEVFTQPTAHLWTIRDGRAIRMQSYWERPDALKAAGIEE